MPERRFCVFILTHGRPREQSTLDNLLRQGYTGDWFLVLDDEDATRQEYLDRYGEDRILTFSKQQAAAQCDMGDNNPSRMTILPARNVSFDLARELGYTHFLQLDDDYTEFQFREEIDGTLYSYPVRNLDQVFATMLDFLDDTGADMVALAQGGDYIGGTESRRWHAKVLRKVMNTFFVRTDCEVRFLGRMNDDVNMYTLRGHQGRLFLSTMYCMVVHGQTQSREGGLTELYLDSGTYTKSFYSVMYCPSAVDVRTMGATHRRIHHTVRWDNCAPKILREEWKQ